ncbi:hypothetical protein [Novosphingobium sp.]|uniref:hypothetical protein n=1 Tax=Novosphingobium sp. TaxID=1874826 RepID=UPI00352B7C2C
MQDTTTMQPGSIPRRGRRGWTTVLVGLLLLVAVSVAVGWLAWKNGLLTLGANGVNFGPSPAAPATPPTPLPLVSAGERAANDAAVAGATAKLAALEQRLAELNQQASAASGQATHAEALLAAFAARRAIERGQQLGYLETQLRIRFGDSQPNAVDRVISAAGKPVTLGSLSEDFERLRPQLTGGSPDEGGWQWFKREMGNLFVIRHDDMPSPSPERRVDRVRSFLAGNRVDMAIIEVERMPGHDAATEWLAHARDYVMTQHALDQLETAALVTPTPPPPATIVPSRPILPPSTPQPAATASTGNAG